MTTRSLYGAARRGSDGPSGSASGPGPGGPECGRAGPWRAPGFWRAFCSVMRAAGRNSALSAALRLLQEIRRKRTCCGRLLISCSLQNADGWALIP